MTDPPFITIPTWQNGNWGETSFKTRDSYRDFVTPLFIEPGKYQFDDVSFIFNEQAWIFRKNNRYNEFVKNGKDYIQYWDTHKERCRRGAVFKSGKKVWYIAREYYMWLNFLQIYDKMQEKFDFPQVWDVQYHMCLYNLLAELSYKHSVMFKKRQICSSYLHCAKMINLLWFEEGVTIKMGAALKSKVNGEGSWKFLEEYRNFLNKNTAWYRPMNPGKVGLWEQKVETSFGGRTTTEGLKGTVTMLTFDKDETAGVGGPCKLLYHEEFGIAPKGDGTYRYGKQAMRSGMLTTGLFIGAGSVGDLEKCEPLKKFIFYPDENDFYSVESNLIDEKGTVGRTGLFIPEQWSMPPFIDNNGNSEVEEALSALNEEFKQKQKDLTPEDYQLEVSQRPRNIAEGFAYRKESKFPLHLVSAQERRIEDKTYSTEYVDLEKNEHGKVIYKQSKKLPISEFPLSKKAENKEGVVVIYERPVENPKFGMYYGSVDPIKTGKTVTSESLCVIYIYKNDTEVTRIEKGETKVFIEHGKIVATWCGRFDDLTKTHERLELLIELYNAWTIVENNVSQFIIYMIAQHKQKYLVPKDQIIFLKDLGSNMSVFAEYGYAMNGKFFEEHLLHYGVAFLKEELTQEVLADGTVVKTTYGIERIPDIMLLKEMKAHGSGGNFDRLVAYCALIAFVKVQQANRGYARRLEEVGKQERKKQDEIYKVSHNMFRHIGQGGNSGEKRPPRSPFKNLK